MGELAYAIGGAGAFFVVFGALLLCWLMVRTAQEDGNDCIAVSVPMAQRRLEVVWLDEVLTMSTIVAALSGQPRWVERYNEHVGNLTTALAALDALLPEAISQATAQKTSAANDRLIEIETLVHEAVLANDTAAAQALIFGDEYQRQKKEYAEGYHLTEVYIQGTLASLRESQAQTTIGGSVALVAGAVTLCACTAAAVLLWRYSRRQAQDVTMAQQCAEAIADMKLDEQLSVLQSISEPSRVQAAFIRIIMALQQYRSFLPRSVLAIALDSSSDEGGDTPAAPIPPSGQVALCFTDIIGSTALWQAAPEDMEIALTTHNRVIRKAARKHGGYEVKTIGDAFMLAFQDPIAATQFGVQVQEELLDAQWPESRELANVSPYWALSTDASDKAVWRGLALRVGIAYGDARQEVNPVTERVDYRGPTVNLASRIESAAMYGVVCVSDTLQAYEDELRHRGINMVARPPRELKGIGMCRMYVVTTPRLQPRYQWQSKVVANVLTTAPRLSSQSMMAISVSPAQADHNDQSNSDCFTNSSHGSVSQPAGRQQTDGPTLGSSGLRASGVPDPVRFECQLSPTTGTVAVVSHLDGDLSVRAAQLEDYAGRVSATLNTALQQCIVSASRTQGKVTGVHSSCAYVSWFASGRCSAHQSQAIDFARFMLSSNNMRLHTALASGELYRGNSGTSRQRFPVVVGVPTRAADVLSQETHRLGARCLAAFHTAPHPGSFSACIRMRPVDVWSVLVKGAQGVATLLLTVTELSLGGTDQEGDRSPSPTALRTSIASESPYTGRFWAALQQGSAQALQDLTEEVQQFRDLVGIRVAEQLAEHVRMHPAGAPSRREVPFTLATPSIEDTPVQEAPSDPFPLPSL
eukprot:TRINITY_DN8117_c0_g1_i3.p1 TRINITY_DN8117_c0_g1~~TRINITY_DN8117_c0_g1_i3.p1  ORF type:complete len:867 (+),score=168.21 TRINITY_DN8117_c0_g1_i3:86-2686(+)